MRKSPLKRTDLTDAAAERSVLGGKCANMQHKLLLQLLGITAGLTLSAWGHAVGMGGINVISALGQPLKAEIELLAVSKADKPSLVARLASPDAYKGAGLDYPYNTKYSFEVGSRADGEPYLKLVSSNEINDPFVSLLVELSWASGRLMREYTFLLDPPGYVAAKPAEVVVVAPEVVHTAPLSEPAKAETAKPQTEKPEAEKPTAVKTETVKPKPVERAVEHPVEKTAERVKVQSSVTVKSGDSLNKIAAQTRTGDISLERMLVALYRANADQFDGKNMNRIKTGKILRMPEQDELVNVTQSEAVQEIRAQSSDWNAYRQKLAGAAVGRAESSQQVARGKISVPVADKTPVASESAKEVLRLSKGEAPGKKTGGAGHSANADAEDAIAKAKALEEAKTRAALLEANRKDMERLAKLKSEAAALVATAEATKVAAAMDAVSQVAAASEVVASHVEAAATSHVAASSQVAAASNVAAVSAVAAVEEVTLMDSLMANPVMLGLGAAALAVLGGLGIAMGRRKKQAEVKAVPPVDLGAGTAQMAVPVAPSPDTGDFTVPPVADVTPHPDDVDPISEAELFLNFGRDEQAEEVLKEALLRTPDNHQLHLKLLGIYAQRKDTASFKEIAGLLEGSGDYDAMQQAEVLAQKMEDAAASIEEVGSATSLNAQFGAEEAQQDEFASHVADAEPVEAAEQLIDFDVTTTQPAQTDSVDFDVTSTSPMLSVPDTLDFDIGGKPAAEPEEAMPNLDDLIFDVMSAQEDQAGAGFGISEAKPAEDDGMEFTLDFPTEEAAEKTSANPVAIDLSDISLDLNDAPVAEKSEQWHEVATKLDLARAYQEMGDEVGSREILEEVLQEGDAAQQQEAQLLIKQLA